jgi:hypothetical protein
MKGKTNTDPINAGDRMNGEPKAELPNEQYCYFYNDLMSVCNSLNALCDLKLLNFICLHLNKPCKGTVYLTTNFKERAAKETGYSDRSISRSINSLKKHHILLPGPDSGKSKRFYVNPLCLWKGEYDDRVALINSLRLRTKTVFKPKREPKVKANRARVKGLEIDFAVPIKERQGVVRAILKELQKKLGYPEPLCKKFYEFYTKRAGETEDGQKIMEFERIALRENREFQWEWKLKNWNRTERPDRISKAEQQDKELRTRKPALKYEDYF